MINSKLKSRMNEQGCIEIFSQAESISRWLEGNGRMPKEFLLPGLSVREIEECVDGLPISLSAELKCLYRWKNGTKNGGYTIDASSIFPGFFLVPLHEAIINYNVFSDDKRWNPSWFPFLANGGGDFYVIECQSFEIERAPVVGFMIDRDDHEIEYLSILTMLKTIDQCYERGAFFVDKDGYLDADLIMQVSIAHEINPGLIRWERSLNQLL